MNGEKNQEGMATSAAAAAPVNLSLSANAMAAIGYFCGLGAIVALVLEPYKDNEESRFHAIQALLFQGVWIAGNVAFGICSFIVGTVVALAFSALNVSIVPRLFAGSLGMLSALLGLGMLAMWVYLIVAAANGKNPQIPKLAKYARQFSRKN